MFRSLGLFQSVSCPDGETCSRLPCLFSHRRDLPSPTLNIPAQYSNVEPSSSLVSHQQFVQTSTIPTKRQAPISPPKSTQQPPRKFQKVAIKQRSFPVPSATENFDTGVPILKVNAAQSRVPLPVRQTMLKTLYDHFVVLYDSILRENPMLASDHALQQEEEVYKKSTKQTYRVAIIQCIAALKRRTIPTSISHPSVGTGGEILAKEEAKRSMESLHLSRDLLEPLIHSTDELEKWGYFVDIPSGPGGHQPSLEGKVSKCERCGQPFQVKRMEEADQCTYHWGRLFATRMNGEKSRVYNCCSRPSDSDGCVHGPHAFYESAAEDLHARHPFSFLEPPDPDDTALDVAAVDCEMIYTTGGMRVARVSVVDGSGKEILDEFIRMDEGVHVIDYNTRFSGITEEKYSRALLSLASIRQSLNSFINANTILLGHALDNDLKTLRIIHLNCVDTAILFPHRAGRPYRRSLKDLVREKLGKVIQSGTGDPALGHSSVEDASATLDLVRWHILNNTKAPERSQTSAVHAS